CRQPGPGRRVQNEFDRATCGHVDDELHQLIEAPGRGQVFVAMDGDHGVSPAPWMNGLHPGERELQCVAQGIPTCDPDFSTRTNKIAGSCLVRRVMPATQVRHEPAYDFL